MKVYDVISESKEVNEAPMGMMQKLGSKLQSKLPGNWGAAGKSKLNVGGEANRLKKDLVTYMSGAGIKSGQLTPDEFVQFLDQVGLEGMKTMSTLSQERDAAGVEPDAPLTRAEVDQYLLKATQAGFRNQGMKGKRSKFAGPAATGPGPGGAGAGGAAGSSALPPNLVSSIGTLTPQQKAALAAMLGGNP